MWWAKTYPKEDMLMQMKERGLGREKEKVSDQNTTHVECAGQLHCNEEQFIPSSRQENEERTNQVETERESISGS
jgi:hypothetical protein